MSPGLANSQDGCWQMRLLAFIRLAGRALWFFPFSAPEGDAALPRGTSTSRSISPLADKVHRTVY